MFCFWKKNESEFDFEHTFLLKDTPPTPTSPFLRKKKKIIKKEKEGEGGEVNFELRWILKFKLFYFIYIYSRLQICKLRWEQKIKVS